MEFLEKDLEEIIFNADKKKLAEKGLNISGKLFRQFKIGNYGIADLLCYQRPFIDRDLPSIPLLVKGTINIIELKKDSISVSSFLQALRYAKGVKSFLEKRECEHLYDIKIILIGKRLDLESSFIYLTDFLSRRSGYVSEYSNNLILELYTYSYGIDGMEFIEHSNYSLKNEGF